MLILVDRANLPKIVKNLDSGKSREGGLGLVRPNKRQHAVSTYNNRTYIFFANLEHGQEQNI